MGCRPGLPRRMCAIATVDSRDQGGDEGVRLPAKIAALLHHCGKGPRNVPTQLGDMWSLSSNGGIHAKPAEVMQGQFSSWP